MLPLPAGRWVKPQEGTAPCTVENRMCPVDMGCGIRLATDRTGPHGGGEGRARGPFLQELALRRLCLLLWGQATPLTTSLGMETLPLWVAYGPAPVLGTGLARALGCCFPKTLSTVSEMLGLEVVRLGESSHQTLLLPGLSGGLLLPPTRGRCGDRQGHLFVGCHGQEVVPAPTWPLNPASRFYYPVNPFQTLKIQALPGNVAS